MRRFALVVAMFVVLGLAGVPSAVAAAPGIRHFSITDSFTDEDFCGSGQAVDVSISVRGTDFFAPNQPVGFRNVSQGNVVYTNPENDATVIRHFAGPTSDTTISGDPNGEHVQEIIVSGLSGQLRTGNGSVLLGAGYVLFHETFDGEEFVSREILVDRGPHPNLQSGLAQFCEVMTEALGLN